MLVLQITPPRERGGFDESEEGGSEALAWVSHF